MIDTIRLVMAGTLRDEDEIPNDFSVSFHRGEHLEGGAGETERLPRDSEQWICQEKNSGLRIGGVGRLTATWVEVSLPRLLFGWNGRCIGGQEELDAAWQKLQRYVDLVCTNVVWMKCTRLDLVWQFTGDPADFVRFHRQARHPFVRKACVEYLNQAIEFPGRNCRIRIYDKRKEQEGRPGRVVRAEVQLRGDVLRRVIGESLPPFDLDQLYCQYRSLFCMFRTGEIPDVQSIYEFVAWLQSIGWEYQGLDAVEVATRHKAARTRRRWRTLVANATLREGSKMSWERLLPGDRLPVAVVCEVEEKPEE